MLLKNLNASPLNDPSDLIRLRDSIYAADLIITAISHLDFFSRLDKRALDFETICEVFGIKSRPADVMLTYFRALNLISLQNKVYTITEKAKEFLTRGSNWSLVPYFSTQAERPIVEKMLTVLRTGIPAGWSVRKDGLEWGKAMEREDFADMFTEGMDSRGAYFAPGLALSFDFSAYNSILDIAGASGIYACCIQEKYPEIRTGVLEKPPVDQIIKRALSKKNLGDKISIIGADMFLDEIPHGYDIHLYSHVLHDWDIEKNRQLMRSSYRSLNKHGIVMIHDAHINRDKNGPLSVAEYSVLLMFSTEGKCYSIGEIEALLVAEGFVDISFVTTVGNRSIITGRKV